MIWPNCTDYQEFIQNPKTSFEDYELKYGRPVLNNLGLPKVISGNFASVFQFDCSGHMHAVRCFNRYQRDQQARYMAISSYLDEKRLPCMVDFNFIPQGIRIRGQWYPILKMDWIEGETLNSFIERNLGHPEILEGLSAKFLELISALRGNSIAHGDLQHGNILISNNEIKLIDYDGMYVPILREKTSNEIGHPNYQHPFRTERDFGPFLDNFSAWIIFLSIQIVSCSPRIWQDMNGGDEKLVFCRQDFENPYESRLVRILDSSNDFRLKEIGNRIKSICYCPSPSEVCVLDEKGLSSLPKDQPISIKPIRPIPISPGDASWIWDHMPISYCQIRRSALLERIALSSFIILILISALISPSIGFPRNITGLVFVLSASILLGFTHIRYKSIPEVQKKRVLLHYQKELAAEIIKNGEKIEELIREKTRHESEGMRKENDSLLAQRQLAQKEHDELVMIKSELQKKTAYINSILSSHTQNENTEIQQALRTHQAHFLNQKLAMHLIAQSTIPGIGIELKNRLKSNGVRTAADISKVTVVSSGYGRYLHDVVYLELVGRGSVHIEGIGSKKAYEIVNWKRRIESRYMGQMPQTLPPDQLKKISSKYDLQGKILAEKERNARFEAEKSCERVRSKYRQERENLLKQISATRIKYQEEIDNINNKIGEQNKTLAKKNYEYGKMQHEIKSYRYINIGNYLKKIIH